MKSIFDQVLFFKWIVVKKLTIKVGLHSNEFAMGPCLSTHQQDDMACKHETLIVWDMENIHPPITVDPGKIISFIRDRNVVMDQDRKHSCILSISSITRDFLTKYLDKKYEDQLIIAGVQILLASAFAKKRDADYVLKKQIIEFVFKHMNVPSNAKIVLITSDSDFSMVVNMALNAGIDVQLIYDHNKAGTQITSIHYKNPPVIWQDLVKEVNGGILPELMLQRKAIPMVSPDTQSKYSQVNAYELEPIDVYDFVFDEPQTLWGSYAQGQWNADLVQMRK